MHRCCSGHVSSHWPRQVLFLTAKILKPDMLPRVPTFAMAAEAAPCSSSRKNPNRNLPQHQSPHLGHGGGGSAVQLLQQPVVVDPHAAGEDAHSAPHLPRRAGLRGTSQSVLERLLHR